MFAAREPGEVLGVDQATGGGFGCSVPGAAPCLEKACHQPQALGAGKGLGEERMRVDADLREYVAGIRPLQVAELPLLPFRSW